MVEQAALGFAIATLARSQLAGIGAGIAFYFGEGFASIFLPDIIRYMPFAVARASIDTGAGGGFGGGGMAARRARPPAPTRRWCWCGSGSSARCSSPSLFTERAEITG